MYDLICRNGEDIHKPVHGDEDRSSEEYAEGALRESTSHATPGLGDRDDDDEEDEGPDDPVGYYLDGADCIEECEIEGKGSPEDVSEYTESQPETVLLG